MCEHCSEVMDPYQVFLLNKYSEIQRKNPGAMIPHNELANSIARLNHGHAEHIIQWFSGDRKVSDVVEIIKGM